MRLNSELSGVIGQDAVETFADAVNLIAQARGAIVRGHAKLNDVKIRIGCGAVSGGTGKDKGSETAITPPTGVRRVA